MVMGSEDAFSLAVDVVIPLLVVVICAFLFKKCFDRWRAKRAAAAGAAPEDEVSQQQQQAELGAMGGVATGVPAGVAGPSSVAYPAIPSGSTPSPAGYPAIQKQ